MKLSPKDNFITYHNIEKTLSKMSMILEQFEFTSFTNIILKLEKKSDYLYKLFKRIINFLQKFPQH